MKESNLGVALVKRACPLCHRAFDAEIVMNRRLTKPQKEKVEKMNGQVVGFMDKPCEDCQKEMSQGFLLIGAVTEKTTDMRNPYLSGDRWIIKHERAKEIFSPEVLAKGACFIDVHTAQKVGLPVKSLDEKSPQEPQSTNDHESIS